MQELPGEYYLESKNLISLQEIGKIERKSDLKEELGILSNGLYKTLMTYFA